MLIGSFAHGNTPALRIDQVEMVQRSPRDGAIYMLDPAQRDRFAQIRRMAMLEGKAAVGFFRSHFRPGPMKPSLADRGLLSGEFKQAVYALLLVHAREPRAGTFFIAANGQLPNESSVAEFQFDEQDFKALPEVESDAEASEAAIQERSKTTRYGAFTIICILLLAAGVMIWSFTRGNGGMPWRTAGSNSLDLAAAPDGNLLRISWNHSAREVSNASGATLIILDGPSRREVRLGPDELKLGVIEYDRVSRHVAVTLSLNETGSARAVHSVEWEQE